MGSSVILEREQSFYYSSSLTGTTLADGSILSSDGGALLSADKAQLTLTLDYPVSIPSSAIDATFEVETASIWNTSYNISTALGNNKFTYIDNTVTQPIITVPDGLYSLTSLNSAIGLEFVNRGEDADQISFAGDSATGFVYVITNSNFQADFTPADSIGTILGFTQRVVPAAPVAQDGYSSIGDTQANFNRVNSFSIKTDLVSQGIPVNNNGVKLLAVVPITAKPGSQVDYVPNHPSKVDARELRGKSKQSFYLQICDQDGVRLPQTESWSVLIVLRYKMLLSSESVPLLDL